MLKLLMINPPSLETINDTSLVICDSETAGQAHTELFSFGCNRHIVLEKAADILDSLLNIINSCPASSLQKIHLVMEWPNILQISLWTSKPSTGDVFTLLRNQGVGSEELKPFKTSDINDIFPWLYYGKRFDVLRKICHIAKRKVEGNFKKI